MRKVMLAALAAFSTAAAAAPAVVHSPYKYLSPWDPARGVQTWAFASGECGEERWGELDGAAVAADNVQPVPWVWIVSIRSPVSQKPSRPSVQ